MLVDNFLAQALTLNATITDSGKHRIKKIISEVPRERNVEGEWVQVVARLGQVGQEGDDQNAVLKSNRWQIELAGTN